MTDLYQVKEEDLKSAPVTDLVDLMVQSIAELYSFKKLRDTDNMALKRKEVQLIQKVIQIKDQERHLVNQ